jgi:tetratricopeptide (TPR) repeat protein
MEEGMGRVRHGLAVLALAALVPARGFAAADDVAIRAAVHDGFVRMALDWPAPVEYQAQVSADTLTIRFARPLHADVAKLPPALAEYVASADLEGQGKILVAHLKRPVTVHAFTIRDKTVVVDLTPVPAAAAKPAEPKVAEPKPKPEPAVTPPPSLAAVHLSGVDKPGMIGVAFAWPRPVAYALKDKAGTARLTFRAAGSIDEAMLGTLLPGLAPTIEAVGETTTVVLHVPAGVHVATSHSRDGVVLEARGLKPPKPPAAAPAPAPTPTPAQTIAAPAPAPATADATPPAPPAPPAPPPASVAVALSAGSPGISLRFDWPVETGAAVFQRAGAVWIVFSVPTQLDLSDPLAHGQQTLDAITQQPAKDATIVRVVPHDGLAPAVRRAGTAWIVDFTTQPGRADAPVPMEAHPTAAPASVSFRVHQASAPVRLDDPDLGPLLVIPVSEVGRGVEVPPQLVDFHMLASVQGLVLQPRIDDLATHIDENGVELTRPGGLELSDERDRLLGHRPDKANRLFDFAGWLGTDEGDYEKRRAELERAIATAPEGGRSATRIALAQFYFAHLFAAETIAVLETVAKDDPVSAGQPAFHALKGAACLLAREQKCAADELGQHALDGDPEAALWRADLAGEMGNEEGAAQGFLDSVGMMQLYPHALRVRFALDAARAMLATGRTQLAGPLVDVVMKDHPAPNELAMATYLEGRVKEQEGRLDDALKLWREAASMNDRPSQARALYARALAMQAANRASPAETVKSLDDLRYLWRGDRFEFELLRKLGEMQLAQGDAAAGLQALQQAVAYYPNEPEAKDVAKETSDAFAALFQGQHGNDLPPLKALVLYDQFHDLEPVGARRDAIVKGLVDRLVQVDLLDRAAGLLDGQVKDRLQGLDKARGTTQLALLRLMDHQPDAAVKALDLDVGTSLPADLARQRTQLRARALMDLGRPQDALALIASDPSRDADRLRADIFWRGHDWKNAATTLGRLAGVPPADGKIDADAGRIVLSLAAALTLDDDQAELTKLRAAYGPAMVASSFAKAFHVLAGSGTANDSADPSTLAGQVAQIGDLQSFMASYGGKTGSDAKAPTVN